MAVNDADPNNLIISTQAWSANDTNTTVVVDDTFTKDGTSTLKVTPAATGSVSIKTTYGLSGTKVPLQGQLHYPRALVQGPGAWEVVALVNWVTPAGNVQHNGIDLDQTGVDGTWQIWEKDALETRTAPADASDLQLILTITGADLGDVFRVADIYIGPEKVVPVSHDSNLWINGVFTPVKSRYWTRAGAWS